MIREMIFICTLTKKHPPPREHFLQIVSHSRIFFTKQFNIVWGGTQMMECTLSMLTQAHTIGYSHYHLISGVDFPIKSQDYIHNFFLERPKQQFIGFDWAGISSDRFIDRVKYYHLLINVIGKRESHSALHRFLTKIEDISLAVQHKLHINRISYDFYKGSSWFSITHDAVTAIIKAQSSILKRYRFGANTDEIWLQTFIKNSGFSTHLAESNMRYIKWIQGNPSPEILTMADYDDLCTSEMLFARKFDWNVDNEVVLRLAELHTKEHTS